MQCIADGIFLVQPPHKALFPYSNSLFIKGDSKLLIDAGCGSIAYAEVMAKGLDLLLLSHYHFDHTNGLDFFPEANVMCGKEELWAYTDEELYLESTGYSIWNELMDESRNTVFARTFSRPDDIPAIPGFRPINLNGTFKDGDVFDLGMTKMQVVHTPGHTPGHYSFFFPHEGILFSSDNDLSPRGPWYGALVSDFEAMINSIQKLIDLQPRMIVTSHHHLIFTDELEQKLRSFLDGPYKKEEQILHYLRDPHSLKDILRQDFVTVYPPHSSYQVFWNRMMAKKHLDRLLNRGYINVDEQNVYRIS